MGERGEDGGGEREGGGKGGLISRSVGRVGILLLVCSKIPYRTFQAFVYKQTDV